MKKTLIGKQGEVKIYKVDALPAGMKTRPVEKLGARWIISHSESGHHHLLTGGDVMEREDNVPAGMKILYAILDNPEQLTQDAQVPHEGFDLRRARRAPRAGRRDGDRARQAAGRDEEGRRDPAGLDHPAGARLQPFP